MNTNRQKHHYESIEQAKWAIGAELKPLNYRTTRTFWAEGKRYIARKTNKKAGYANLTVKLFDE